MSTTETSTPLAASVLVIDDEKKLAGLFAEILEGEGLTVHMAHKGGDGLAKLDDAGFRAFFSGSPIKRIGRARFLRNVLIAIGNSGDISLAGEAERLLADRDPLIRGAAVWALSRLAPERAISLQGKYLPAEADSKVRDEWAKGSRSEYVRK